jgi:hypothetical protein
VAVLGGGGNFRKWGLMEVTSFEEHVLGEKYVETLLPLPTPKNKKK